MIAAAPQIRLNLMGDVEIFRDDVYRALPASRKTRALLAYLAATGRPHRRERLCTLFWDMPDDPRGALRWSLSRLRPLLDDEDQRRLIADRETVALETRDIDVDLLRARALLAGPACEFDTERLSAAAAQIRGEFGEGLDLPTCSEFQSWLVAERAATRQVQARLLTLLVDRLADRPEAALAHARRRAEIDPDNVGYQTELLRLVLAAQGRREAEEQFEVAAARLGEIAPGARDELTLHWRRMLRSSQTPQRASAEAQGEAPVREPAPGADTSEAIAQIADLGGERKQATILHVALRVDLAALNLDPEAAAEQLTGALAAIRTVIARFGGTVCVQGPEGLAAVFGAPTALQDHVNRACLAALAIRQMGAAGAGWAAGFGIGLAAGELMIRPADEDGVEVFGPATQVARILAQGGGGAILLPRDTFALVDGLFDFEATRPDPALSGVPIVALRGRTAHAGGWYARVARGLTTFVGREPEFATLDRVLARAAAANGQAAVIVGEPGVGKSRLLHELLLRPALAKSGWLRLEAGATPYDRDSPYFLVGRLLRDWLGVGAEDDAAMVESALEAALGKLEAPDEHARSALRMLLDLPPDPRWQQLDAGLRRRRVIDTINALIAAEAREQPVLIALEDLHWADAESDGVIGALIDRLAGRRLAIIATARPESIPRWQNKSFCHTIRLTALEDQAAADLTESLLGSDPALAALKRMLIAHSQGTPLFLEEAVNTLAEAGILVGARGSYRLTRRVETIAIPPSVNATIAERIDRLPVELKLTLQLAAVIGEDVAVSILQPLLGIDAAAMESRLDALQAAEFLFESHPLPDRRLAFKHALTRDVAYQSLLVSTRRRLHRRVLDIMLERFPNRLDEHVERLSHHALSGERWEKAARFLQLAGDKSIARSAYREAARFYEQALEALDRLEPSEETARQRVELCLRLRPPLGAIAAFGRAFDYLTQAEDLIPGTGSDERLVTIAIHKSYILSSQGRLHESVAAAERAIALADAAKHAYGGIEARLALGQALAFRGDAAGIGVLAPILPVLTGKLRHERMGQTGVRSVWGLSHMAELAALRGDFAVADGYVAEAIKIAGEVDRPYDRAVAHLREGFVALHRGEVARAAAALERGRSLAEATDLPWVTAWILAGLGFAHVLAGNQEAGRHLLEANRRRTMEVDYVIIQANSEAFLADAYRRIGEWALAEERATSALELARAHGYWFIEVFALRQLGLICRHAAKRRSEGERRLEQSIKLATALGFAPELARSRDARAS